MFRSFPQFASGGRRSVFQGLLTTCPGAPYEVLQRSRSVFSGVSATRSTIPATHRVFSDAPREFPEFCDTFPGDHCNDLISICKKVPGRVSTESHQIWNLAIVFPEVMRTFSRQYRVESVSMGWGCSRNPQQVPISEERKVS